MAKVIQIKKTFEEYNIGNHIFRIDVSDDNMMRLEKEANTVLVDIDKCNTYGELSGILKTFFNFIFDDKTAGDKVYDACGGSSMVVVDVLSQLTDDIKQIGIKSSEKKNASIAFSAPYNKHKKRR